VSVCAVEHTRNCCVLQHSQHTTIRDKTNPADPLWDRPDQSAETERLHGSLGTVSADDGPRLGQFADSDSSLGFVAVDEDFALLVEADRKTVNGGDSLGLHLLPEIALQGLLVDGGAFGYHRLNDLPQVVDLVDRDARIRFDGFLNSRKRVLERSLQRNKVRSSCHSFHLLPLAFVGFCFPFHFNGFNTIVARRIPKKRKA
jgi:hypothetical protein